MSNCKMMPIELYLENEQANNKAISSYIYIYICIYIMYISSSVFPPRKHHAKYTDTINFV